MDRRLFFLTLTIAQKTKEKSGNIYDMSWPTPTGCVAVLLISYIEILILNENLHSFNMSGDLRSVLERLEADYLNFGFIKLVWKLIICDDFFQLTLFCSLAFTIFFNYSTSRKTWTFSFFTNMLYFYFSIISNAMYHLFDSCTVQQ